MGPSAAGVKSISVLWWGFRGAFCPPGAMGTDMDVGAFKRVDVGACTDIYWLETGMYDTTGYGVVYIIDADRPAIIDTGIGTGADHILAALDDLGINRTAVEVIAPTHVHLDHAGGAGRLAEACPNATVYAHERGAPHLADPSDLIAGTQQAVGDQWQYYVEPTPIPDARITPLTDGDTIDLGDRSLRVHHAPGHALHQVIFESPADDAVFVADAAGLYLPEYDRVQESSPPSTFNLEQVLGDVDTIEALDPDALLYPHYGPAPADDQLERYRERITDWVETVAAHRDDRSDDALREYFADRVDEELIDAWGEHKAREEIKLNVRGACQYLDYVG